MNNYQNIIDRIKQIEQYVGIGNDGSDGNLLDKIEEILNKSNNILYQISDPNAWNVYIMNEFNKGNLYEVIGCTDIDFKKPTLLLNCPKNIFLITAASDAEWDSGGGTANTGYRQNQYGFLKKTHWLLFKSSKFSSSENTSNYPSDFHEYEGSMGIIGNNIITKTDNLSSIINSNYTYFIHDEPDKITGSGQLYKVTEIITKDRYSDGDEKITTELVRKLTK